MQSWLLPALFALFAWAVQRLLGKVALTTLGTSKFYLLSAGVSLVTYTPYILMHPPPLPSVLPAFGLACLMAITFGVTTEAIRRGPLGAVSLLSVILQGLGAFLAKVVVTPAGPSALLLMGAAVQVVVGLFLAPPRKWGRADFRGRPAVFTVIAYVLGGVATIGYLLALASGPAALVVPLVSTSPALAGLLGVAVLKEKTSRRQLAGIGLALLGAALLARA